METQGLEYIPGRISVVMPCYNAEAHLTDSIESVLGQTHPDVELIVVDDGSTDNSNSILDSFNDRIISLSQTNKGPGPARNKGIAQATGEYVAFLDSDDYWDQNCLQELYQALNGTDAALSYCGWQNVGGPANRSQPYIPPDYESSDKAERFLQTAAPWPIHAALVRHDALKAVGCFDEQWATCMDYDLWLKVGTGAPIILVEKVMAYYRHHGTTQITSNQWRQAQNVLSVKQHFIQQYPEQVSHLSTQKLRELTYGAYLKRGFDAYWKRDLVSAHHIFRRCLKERYFQLKQLKYLLPALLPKKLFIKLIGGLEGNQG